MKKLTDQELLYIQEISRIAGAEEYKASYFEQNTALLNVELPFFTGKLLRFCGYGSGKMLAKQQRKVADLTKRLKDEHVTKKLMELGYENNQNVSIDLKTGAITMITK